MKKITLIVATLVASYLLVACNSTPTTTASVIQAPVVQTASVTPTEHYVTRQADEYKQPDYCPKTYESKNSADYLKWLDIDLDAIAKGNDTCGSFSDWFAPNLGNAIDTGATVSQVEKRIDRMVALAEQGKFLSSFEQEMFNRTEDGGAKAVRRYAEDVAGIKDK